MEMKIAFIVMTFLGITVALNKDNVIIAINCGSNTAHIDQSNVEYSADKYFKNGIESNLGERYSSEWTDFPDIELYQTERYAVNEDLEYLLPLKKGEENGAYVLVLKFSEVYFDSPNQKVFDVKLGSHIVTEEIDIFKEAGRFSPLDKYIEFKVQNKKVIVNGKEIQDAINPKNSELILKFAKGHADNPKCNAVVLVKGTLKDTDYKAYKNFHINREKIKQIKQDQLYKKRTQEINKILKSDEDLDLSSLGKSRNPMVYKIVPHKDALKSSIESFLSIPFALELCCFSFVAIFFFVFAFLWNPKKTSKEKSEQFLSVIFTLIIIQMK